MPSLKQQVADKKAQEPTLKRTPEIDAKLDEFIKNSPVLMDYYQGLSKDDLIRKLMLGKMNRRAYTANRNEELRSWVEENPDVKARVEERIRNVPEANRARAFINVARREAESHGMRNGNGVRP
jgi:hypothetical protein